jgi:hypothetical protein
MAEPANRATEAPSPPRPSAADAVSLDDVLADWRWVFASTHAGQFEQYRGQHIAVVGRRVLASDTDPMRLRQTVAEQYHVHPERIVIDYVEIGDEVYSPEDWDE